MRTAPSAITSLSTADHGGFGKVNEAALTLSSWADLLQAAADALTIIDDRSDRCEVRLDAGGTGYDAGFLTSPTPPDS